MDEIRRRRPHVHEVDLQPKRTLQHTAQARQGVNRPGSRAVQEYRDIHVAVPGGAEGRVAAEQVCADDRRIGGFERQAGLPFDGSGIQMQPPRKKAISSRDITSLLEEFVTPD